MTTPVYVAGAFLMLALSFYGAYLMLKRIEWGIEAGAPPPFTLKRLRWDLVRLLGSCVLEGLQDGESKAMREMSPKAVEKLRRSLDRHHGPRATGELIELTGDVGAWKRPDGELVFQSKRSAQWN